MKQNYNENIETKPIFNLKWYTGRDEYSEGHVEDEIIEMICKEEPENYSEAIHNNLSWSSYYHLTNIRKNIINWYPFRPDADVLEIGCGMGAITDCLCENCHSVTAVEMSKRRATATLLRCRNRENLEIIVGNLNDIKFEKKFDYITLIGVLEYQGDYTDTENPYHDFLKKIKSLLKPDGKLLIAIENQYGLKYWCGAREDHTGIPFEGLNQYRLSNRNVRTFSKKGLEKLVRECGFKNTYFYYPMPDYKLPTVIYSQDYLPKNDNMLNMTCYYIPDNYTLVANEKDLYKDIIDNNAFEFFANSFLLECSEDSYIGKVKFASISNKRQKEYQVITRFIGDSVEKYSVHKDIGRKHMQQILENEKAFQQRGLHVWKSDYIDGKLVTPFCDKMTCEEKILDDISNGNQSAIVEMFDKLYNQIIASSEQADWEENILYSFYPDLEKDKNKYGIILKMGYLDMIFRNAFWIDNEFWWFDQEWNLENVPAKYPMYRAIVEMYHSYPNLQKIVSVQDIIARYDIGSSLDEIQALEKLFIGVVCDKYGLSAGNSLPSISDDSIVNTINRIL